MEVIKGFVVVNLMQYLLIWWSRWSHLSHPVSGFIQRTRSSLVITWGRKLRHKRSILMSSEISTSTGSNHGISKVRIACSIFHPYLVLGFHLYQLLGSGIYKEEDFYTTGITFHMIKNIIFNFRVWIYTIRVCDNDPFFANSSILLVLPCVFVCVCIYVCEWIYRVSDLNGNWQRDAGSVMRSKMSGISLATRIRSIRQGQGLIEQPWPGFGRRQAGTRLCMIRLNSLAWGKPSSSTRAVHQMDRKLTGSCMNTGLNLRKMDRHRQASS